MCRWQLVSVDKIIVLFAYKHTKRDTYASQHTHGEAADKEILNRWFDWIVENTNFDIIETSNGKDFWIHVSCRKNIKKNPHQVIRHLVKK